ncbi:MAG: hypothetical protein ACREOE_04745 [Gemmatimonadales bacterium]
MRADRLGEAWWHRRRARLGVAVVAGVLATLASACSSSSTADRPVLRPARVRPVADVCRLPLTRSHNGSVAPLQCAGGGVNVLAWQALATGSAEGGAPIRPSTLGAGPLVDTNQVWAMLCNDAVHVFGSIEKAVDAERLASIYYGWRIRRGDPVATFRTRGCPAPRERQDAVLAGTHVAVSFIPYKAKAGTRVTVYGYGFRGPAQAAAFASEGAFSLVQDLPHTTAAGCRLAAQTPVGSISVDDKGELGSSFVVPSDGSCAGQSGARPLPAGTYDVLLQGDPGVLGQVIIGG